MMSKNKYNIFSDKKEDAFLEDTFDNGYNEYCFSLKALEDYEYECKKFLNPEGDSLDFFSIPMATQYHSNAYPVPNHFQYYDFADAAWYISSNTTSASSAPSSPSPKFKEGDVIIYVEDEETRFPGTWIMEKGEKFYVQRVDGDGSYWLRVVFSVCGTQKDFPVEARRIDSKCEYLNSISLAALSHTPPIPAKEPAPYFPSLSQLSHV